MSKRALPWLLALATSAHATPKAVDPVRAHADASMQKFEHVCRTATPAPGCHELAFDAAADYRALGEPARSMAALRAVIHLDDAAGSSSPLGGQALLLLARGYQALGAYDQTAEWYERFVAAQPAHAEAPNILVEATKLRLALGDLPRAVVDLQQFVRSYAAAHPMTAADVVLAAAAVHAEREQWNDARMLLTLHHALLEAGAADTRLRAHALLARVAASADKPDRAKALAEYAGVDAAYGSGTAIADAITRDHADEPESSRARRLAMVLIAVGEARFEAAEERRRKEVDGAARAVKHAAIEKVETAYLRPSELLPFPPPQWTVASAAATAAMWARFADSSKKREDYTEMKGQARAHARAAMALSVRLQVRDERIEACEAWLANNYPDEFHPVDEIAPKLRTLGVDGVTGPTPTPN